MADGTSNLSYQTLSGSDAPVTSSEEPKSARETNTEGNNGKKRSFLGAAPFIAVHFLALGGLFTGVTVADIIVCIALYWIRMFAVTGAYHRYFSHRTYKTSRVFQFLLAFLAETSSQKGALWWAAHHRRHHKYSDQPEDIHSPRQRGLFYAHVGWMFNSENDDTDYSKIRDLAKYPELRFLNRYWMLPPIMLGFAVWFFLGWSGLWTGFMLSTVLLWHGTFTINSLSHVFGKRVYQTTDDSRNSFLLAIITMGEGWHNNHHYYQASTRQGFHWWQIDMTYYVLKMLSWMGLVWDLKEPPAHVVAGKWKAKSVKDHQARSEENLDAA